MPQCVTFENVHLPSDEVDIPVLRPAWIADGEPCGPNNFTLFTGDEAQAIQAALAASSPGSDQLPPANEIGAAWGAGFTIVVGCYAIARAAGAVLSMLK